MNLFIKLSFVTLAATLLAGCANVPMGAPQASLDNTARLRSQVLPTVNVGSFSLDSKLEPSKDQYINLRGTNRVSSPYGNSFAKYLRETLITELKAANLVAPSSNTVISGVLLSTDADAAIVTGTGHIAAQFSVIRNGIERYNKVQRVDGSWESSFIAAIAIPAAAREYERLYKQLVAQLLQDQVFLDALKKD